MPDVAEQTEREKARRVIAENRKARHDYHVLETWESGVALLGTEVKAIREGRVNLRDSYARVDNGEVWMLNVHISPYSHRGYAQHAEMRQRKLLLHSHEIRKLVGRTKEKGLTLVPLELYFKNGRVKVLLALAKGKQAHDKRETIRRREVDRETRAAVKSRSARRSRTLPTTGRGGPSGLPAFVSNRPAPSPPRATAVLPAAST